MKFKDIFIQTIKRIKTAKKKFEAKTEFSKDIIQNLIESLSEDWIEKALNKAKETLAPSFEEIPIDLQLRQSNIFRKTYNKIFPVNHAFRINYRYGREFLDEYMPISENTYLGRGNYKFVYALPWKMVIKISKNILLSDPIYGSLFTQVRKDPEKFLTKEEISLYEYLSKNFRRSQKEKLWLKFLRLGLERYHYIIVKEYLPDLVIPTRFFMGVQYRKLPFMEQYVKSIRPMDVQVILTGKHLKQFIKSGKRIKRKGILNYLLPSSFEFKFDVGIYGNVKKKILVKIKEDLRRLIFFTKKLAKEEKLILDIHTENLIISLPEFELKLFDFHIFDEHLYDYGDGVMNPEQEHIEIIEQFIESFGLE
ncbi:MAG: hypothetical protein ACK4UJ_03710 [Leptonema sp. (in: bacteria)]